MKADSPLYEVSQRPGGVNLCGTNSPDGGQGIASVLRRYGWLVLFLGLLLIVWVLNASKAGTHTEGCPERCSTAGERRDGPLRVMSLNVLHGHPDFEHLSRRLDLIADEIRRRDADIVCLQEVPWTRQLGSGAEYLSQRAGLSYLYLRANGNRWTILFEEGVAILSRYPLQDPTFVELEPQAGFFEHRVVLHATATTPWGDVGVFVTHLTDGDADINLDQAASLMHFVGAPGSDLSIVAGDFNATEDSPQIKALTQQWMDIYRVANPDDEGLTCCIDNLAGGPMEPLEERIDYLFLVPQARQGVKVHSAQRVLDQPFQVSGGWQWASDHVGLLAAIEIEH
jgi:endonuclease/exonuclease/phosphatase family metal-dependent hydrolase